MVANLDALRSARLPPEVTAAFEFLSTLSRTDPDAVAQAAIGSVDLRGSVLTHVVVKKLDLAGCQFKHCDLTGASFIECILVGADFRDTAIHGARFEACRLAGTNFKNSRYDTATSIVGGSYNRETTWHVEGFKPAGAELLPEA